MRARTEPESPAAKTTYIWPADPQNATLHEWHDAWQAHVQAIHPELFERDATAAEES